jgi:hypothetical protein
VRRLAGHPVLRLLRGVPPRSATDSAVAHPADACAPRLEEPGLITALCVHAVADSLRTSPAYRDLMQMLPPCSHVTIDSGVLPCCRCTRGLPWSLVGRTTALSTKRWAAPRESRLHF